MKRKHFNSCELAEDDAMAWEQHPKLHREKFDVTEINSVGDVANLALDIGGDFLLVEAGAKIGSNIAVGLKSLVSSYAPSVASGGGAIVKTGVGGTVADITFSISLSDEVVVTASKVGEKGLAAGAVKTSTKLLGQPINVRAAYKPDSQRISPRYGSAYHKRNCKICG